jgi:hypothetical protein
VAVGTGFALTFFVANTVRARNDITGYRFPRESRTLRFVALE